MPKNGYTEAVKTMQEFFNRSTRCFDEADSNFAPKPGMFTVAQHIAHAAQTFEWFVDGAFKAKGFNTDFAGLEKAVREVKSLKEARAWMDRAIKKAVRVLSTKSAADMRKPIVKETIMGGEPRMAIMSAMCDHAAHHRGALTVYARMLGKVSAMPYMEM